MCDSTCQLPDDNQLDENLINIIQNAKSNILPTDDYQTHVRLLAELVVDNLGGAICKNRISESGYELEIVEIKRARNSNIIPIGHIKKGLYRERALLFKLLADICGVPATLGKLTGRIFHLHPENHLEIIRIRPKHQNVSKFRKKVQAFFHSSPLVDNILTTYYQIKQRFCQCKS